MDLGKRDYGTYKKLYDYYEAEVIPRQLNRFLDEIKNKPLKKALELSELSQEEFEYCCQQGMKGDSKFKEFYQSYYGIKIDVFMNNINKGKDKSKALRNAGLTEKELDDCYQLGKNGDERFSEFYQKYYDKKYEIFLKDMINGKTLDKALDNANLNEDEVPENLDDIIFDKKLNIVMASIKKDFTTKQAANKAHVSVNDIYDWFMKGRSGDEKFKEFSEFYYDEYVSPGSLIVQKALNEEIPIELILRKRKKLFSKQDYEFWRDNGFLKQAQEELEKEEEKEDGAEELKKEILGK